MNKIDKLFDEFSDKYLKSDVVGNDVLLDRIGIISKSTFMEFKKKVKKAIIQWDL